MGRERACMLRLTLRYPSCYRGRVGCGVTVHGVKGFQGVYGVEAKSSASHRHTEAFWRSTAVARICSRIPRSEWYVRGLAKPVGCGVAAGSANIDFEIGPALA